MDESPPIDRLRALIAGDEALQYRLALIRDRHAFGAAAAELAAAHGISVTAEEVAPRVIYDPIGLGRLDESPPNFAGWPGRHWLPVGVLETQAGLAIDWRHFGDDRLTRPFYEDSLLRANRCPLNGFLRIRTPLSTLLKAPPSDATEGPDALIFHMSRCGSTLVSQMIAAMPGHVVVSEPPPLDTIVQIAQLTPGVTQNQRIALLRAMAGALGRDRFGDRKHYVIKLDAWHVLALPLFRAAFPNAPWLFLFRDPVEVMVSQQRNRGMQTMPLVLPEEVYGIAHPLGVPPEDYIARVLAKGNAAAVEHAALGDGLFVDYADLPGALETRILPHFGIRADASALERARAAATSDAKTPGLPFAPDAATKRHEASAAIRTAAATHLGELHRQLTALAIR